MLFFNDSATTEIYTLSLHDALPISTKPPGLSLATEQPSAPDRALPVLLAGRPPRRADALVFRPQEVGAPRRSEEHTSELQSRQYLVCRLLLEKKNTPRVRHLRRARS